MNKRGRSRRSGMTVLDRLRRRLDPRRSLAARLLLGFVLAFAVPGVILVFLLERGLSELQAVSAERLAAARLAQETIRVQDDARFRSEWIERRTQIAEEAAWSLAAAAGLALTREVSGGGPLPRPDAHGHLWTSEPEEETLAYVSLARTFDAAAGRDFIRSREVAPLMGELRRRRPTIRSVSLWTASGVVRLSPWTDLHDGIRETGGELERFPFNGRAGFPARPPAGGDLPVWTPAEKGPALLGGPRVVSLFVPVRGKSEELLAAVALDVDAHRFVLDAAEPSSIPGDIWFATDAEGHGVVMPTQAAQLLAWRGSPGETLGDSGISERQRLARTILASERSTGTYRFRGKGHRFASARARTSGWVFVEGLSEDRIAGLAREEPDPAVRSKILALRGEIVIVFAWLLAGVFAVVLLVSKRISAPLEDLVEVAEEIGKGRSVAAPGREGRDEIGRLAASIDRMGRRVERRVETLRRLHSLFRAAYRTTDSREVLARAAEAIAAFTRADRVWFFLHDRDTNFLEAAWPGWNLPEGLAPQLKISVEASSIPGFVFRTGEVYVSDDLERDPYGDRSLPSLAGARNAIFAPLKTEESTLGVVVATNRAGGFGHEEVDGLLTFADAASLLIKNARLYEELSGTVAELRRASRLKDHFLQNVNHELRTPLTSIVGWTDLFEETEAIDEKMLQRGLRQIRQSARLLLALIDDLLDLARLDRGTLSLDLKPVSLAEIVGRAIETVRVMGVARGLALLQAPLPPDMPLVRADSLRLQQVLWNLLVNAVKFTPRRGRVIVRIELEPERYLVSVEDDGIGISEKELPHVFERFRQVDGSATRHHPGMGIGLSLVRSLVELHGGSIWAESVVGQGSRFTFTLPIRPADRRAADREAATALEQR